MFIIILFINIFFKYVKFKKDPNGRILDNFFNWFIFKRFYLFIYF